MGSPSNFQLPTQVFDRAITITRNQLEKPMCSGAFNDAVNAEMQGMRDDFIAEQNRKMFDATYWNTIKLKEAPVSYESKINDVYGELILARGAGLGKGGFTAVAELKSELATLLEQSRLEREAYAERTRQSEKIGRKIRKLEVRQQKILRKGINF